MASITFNFSNMKYNFNLLNNESQKENFKIQGNSTVDEIFTNIKVCLSEIDDSVGLAEGVN